MFILNQLARWHKAQADLRWQPFINNANDSQSHEPLESDADRFPLLLLNAGAVSNDRAVRITAIELETPILLSRARISGIEFELPSADRRARLSGIEFQIPLVSTKARISGIEFELPFVDGRCRISGFELEIPGDEGAGKYFVWFGYD